MIRNGTGNDRCNFNPAIETHNSWSGTIAGPAWTQVTVPVTNALRTAQFQLRFLLGSDGDDFFTGWTIDDVEIVTY